MTTKTTQVITVTIDHTVFSDTNFNLREYLNNELSKAVGYKADIKDFYMRVVSSFDIDDATASENTLTHVFMPKEPSNGAIMSTVTSMIA
ncbi:hypothetical protein [Shewanella xiamenensis]|uniref:hypothetical protein n=1 Tax=Shewanella xiamenensis TaxID=332186 RepID=UPI0021BE11B9|nr:hypothetical protein [Shewanella xiamenensis]MCT8876646.1 hypothetical protein [Shewanella xiamenensis]